MPLQTFDVPCLEARVRTANHEGEKVRVTVECPYRKLAFYFRYEPGEKLPALATGRWVRFRGKVRLNMAVRKDGQLAEKNLQYSHDPDDGSGKEGWMFFELLEPSFYILGPKDFHDTLRTVETMVVRHMENWADNCTLESMDRTLENLERAVVMLKSVRSGVVSAKEAEVPYAAISV